MLPGRKPLSVEWVGVGEWGGWLCCAVPWSSGSVLWWDGKQADRAMLFREAAYEEERSWMGLDGCWMDKIHVSVYVLNLFQAHSNTSSWSQSKDTDRGSYSQTNGCWQWGNTDKGQNMHVHTLTHKQKEREREKRPAVGPYGDSRTGGQGFTECENAARNIDIKRTQRGERRGKQKQVKLSIHEVKYTEQGRTTPNWQCVCMVVDNTQGNNLLQSNATLINWRTAKN